MCIVCQSAIFVHDLKCMHGVSLVVDPRCPGDRVYTNCGTDCPFTCANKDELILCTLRCRVGECFS